MSDPFPSGAWTHDLRNAVNTIVLSVGTARRLLQADDATRALEMIANAETAADDLRRLVGQLPQR